MSYFRVSFGRTRWVPGFDGAYSIGSLIFAKRPPMIGLSLREAGGSPAMFFSPLTGKFSSGNRWRGAVTWNRFRVQELYLVFCD